MSKSMPGGIRPETVRLLGDIVTKMSKGNITHEQLEKFAQGRNPFDNGFAHWAEKVYDALDMTLEYKEFLESHASAMSELPNRWAVPVLKSVTCEEIIQAFRRNGVMIGEIEDRLAIDISSNDRNSSGRSYAISFADTIDPDPELRNLSAAMLCKKGVKGITLLECLILNFGYYLAKRKPLGRAFDTICTGSKQTDGKVPGIRWIQHGNSWKLCIYSFSSSYHSVNACTRQGFPVGE